MHIRLITLHVKAEYLAAFKEASLAIVEDTVHETGVVRFDILQKHESPSHFVVYEAYQDDAAREKHLNSAHFKAWREKVAAMLEGPLDSQQYNDVFLSAEEWG